MSEYLSRGREPIPLLIDDAFATSDDERARAGMRLLIERLAPRHQVVVVTCHRRRQPKPSPPRTPSSTRRTWRGVEPRIEEALDMRRSSRSIVCLGAAIAGALLVGGANGAGSPHAMTGFRAADADAQRAREDRAVATIQVDSLRRHLRILTSIPHVAGTPADRATAEYVRDRLAAYGWDAKIDAVPVYLNYPRTTRLTLVSPVHEPLRIRERGIDGDKDAFDDQVFDAFHGYWAPGRDSRRWCTPTTATSMT